MTLQLSQKERMLLEDQKSHEDLCVQKYSRYAQQAQDQQLKQLFQSLSSKEQEHLNTINQMLNGNVPNVQQGQQGQQAQQWQQAAGQNPGPGANNQNDALLCQDMLSTEKYISGAYDTAIFEFKDTNVRQVLNHIQKEEQEHGERLYAYMQSHGMYK